MAKVSWMNRNLGVALLVVAMLGPQGASAGQKLRFKTGTVSTTKPIVRGYEGTFSSDAQKPSRFFILQFKTVIKAAHHAALQAAGLKVLRYIPDDALVVEGTAETVANFKKTNEVQAVVPFRAEWKLSPAFAPASVFGAGQVERIFVRVLDTKLVSAVVADLRALGAKIENIHDRSISCEVTQSQRAKVAAIDGVEWLQPAVKMQLMHADLLDESEEPSSETPAPANPYERLTGFETGTKIMNIPLAWGRGYYGATQTIFIADTGFDRGEGQPLHEDFTGRIQGQAMGLFSSNWEDHVGHGTHVAGSIGGNGFIAGGRISGAAPKASLVMQGMWSEIVGGITVPSALGELFQPAFDAGARIHSNSWGSVRDLGAYDESAVQVDEFTFEHPEFLVVFAAGNSGGDRDKDGRIDPGSVSSPSTAKNALSVGASENVVAVGGIQKKHIQLRNGTEIWSMEPIASDTLSNNADGLAAFSSRGPTKDGRIKPDVVAPGTNILSARSKLEGALLLWGEFNSDYLWSGGTSMATPLVAGAAGLVREYLASEKGMSTPSSALVKNILMHTAFDIFPGQYGAVGKENGQEILSPRPTIDGGYGRVDVARAMNLGDALLIDEKTGVGVDEMSVQVFSVNKPGKLSATLVWTDPPGSPNVAKALVNDLKLEVIAPDGTVHAINDDLNNSELVTFEAQPGDYEVRVTGVNIPVGGKQPFSLVVSAD